MAFACILINREITKCLFHYYCFYYSFYYSAFARLCYLIISSSVHAEVNPPEAFHPLIGAFSFVNVNALSSVIRWPKTNPNHPGMCADGKPILSICEAPLLDRQTFPLHGQLVSLPNLGLCFRLSFWVSNV